MCWFGLDHKYEKHGKQPISYNEDTFSLLFMKGVAGILLGCSFPPQGSNKLSAISWIQITSYISMHSFAPIQFSWPISKFCTRCKCSWGFHSALKVTQQKWIRQKYLWCVRYVYTFNSAFHSSTSEVLDENCVNKRTPSPFRGFACLGFAYGTQCIQNVDEDHINDRVLCRTIIFWQRVLQVLTDSSRCQSRIFKRCVSIWQLWDFS